MIGTEHLLQRWEDEALGACHAANRAILLHACDARMRAMTAGVLCERYARGCADRAIEETSPAWAVRYHHWHEAAVDWLQIATVNNYRQLEGA